MGLQSAQRGKTWLSQFWAGRFASDAAFEAFVKENHEAYYSDANDEGDGPLPLSQFAGSQGERRFDHDFMEVGKVGKSAVPTEAICASYSELWAEEFLRRASAVPIIPTHFIMVMVQRLIGGAEHRQFPNPASVTSPDFALIYLGEIEYEDYQ